MTNNSRPALILFTAIFALISISSVAANSFPPYFTINISSSKTLNGTAGDYVTVDGTITNTENSTSNDIITYLSLVDDETKLPVDLEDWSAEKGLHIGTIDVNQTFPLSWKIHFVKAGTYSLILVAENAGNDMPEVSSIIHFKVNPKINLNPGNVLPAIFGTPLILIFTLFLLAQFRQVEK